MNFTSSGPAPVSAPRRKNRGVRILLGIAGGVLLLLLATGGAGALWLRAAARAALPVLDGDLHLPGLSAPVMVRRDAHGVPHIEAANEHDLFMAQGYVTAQDRLWQMDLFRRHANGELAEILGPSLIRHDREQRVLQIQAVARRIYNNLPAEERARLDAYASGVNLLITQHRDSLPPEFLLLAYQPRPWSGVDSISVGLMMVQTLDTRWDTKLARESIAARLHNPRLEADLYPVGSWRDRPPTGIQAHWSQPQLEPAPATNDNGDDEEDDSDNGDDRSQARVLPPTPTEKRFLDALLGAASSGDCQPGSNNWVVDGRHTASGKPLLSNDMHLSLAAPGIWFMADLKANGQDGAPGYHAAGVTLPGVPLVIAGHNEHVAWGFTALHADVQDLYVEKLDGKGHYLAPGGQWKPLLVDRETIRVRGGKNFVLDVQATDHGPLLNPLLSHETRPIALRWTLYDSGLNTLPLYQLNTASNWKEFSAALRSWCWPTQNAVYADDQGHIAYHAVGRVPMRPAGLAGVPIETEGDHEWRGYIPFNGMPGVADPPSGFLATANARVTTGKSPYPLTLEWASPYRVERIYEALEGRGNLRPSDMLAVQTDVYSEVDQEMAHRFAYAINHTPHVDGRLRKAAILMNAWDGRLTTDSAAASLVTQARQALWQLILEPKLGKETRMYRWAEKDFAEEEIVMHASANWLPPSYKNWDALLTDAVRKGMEQGRATGDVALWSYGSWHVMDIEHPVARFLPLLNRLTGTGPQPLSGDSTTVKQVSRNFGPSQRFTMDWSQIDASTENIVMGESGNPLSPYYRDQWNDWYNGKTFALLFTPAAVASHTHHTLRLLP